MSDYQIISAEALSRVGGRFPKLKWPITDLAIGQAFIVPMQDGFDLDGRSDAYVRVLVWKAGQRLRRKFSCNKTAEGLAITRIA